MCRQHVESREMDIRTEYKEASLLSAVCPSPQLHGGINNAQKKKIQIVQRRQGSQLQSTAKAAGNTMQIVFSFQSQIAEQACYQVSFLLVSAYTVRGVISMDEDGHDSGNNNSN